MKYYIQYISVLLPPATKLGQGYIFTGVCDSVNRGVSAPGGCLLSGGDGVCSREGVPAPVRILLECILVYIKVPITGWTQLIQTQLI